MHPLDRRSSALTQRVDHSVAAGFAVLHRLLSAAVALAVVTLWDTVVTVAPNL